MQYLCDHNCWRNQKVLYKAIKLIPGALFIVILVLFSNGCMVNTAATPRPMIKTEGIQAELELSLERSRDKQEAISTKRISKSTVFQEELRFKTKGDVYHPNLMTFIAGLGLGLVQQDFSTNQESDYTTGELRNYDLNMFFLRQKAYPVTVTLNQFQGLMARKFLGPLRVESFNSSVMSTLQVPEWPMNISWSKSKMDQTSDVSDVSDLFSRNSERFSYALSHNFSETSLLKFDYNQENITQTSRGSSTEIDSKEFILSHELRFGHDDQHRLKSFASFSETVGTFEIKRTNLRENLQLQHTDNLSTYYQVRSEERQRPDSKSEILSGSIGLDHQLYESLWTNVNFFGSQNDLDAGNELNLYGSTLSFDYKKKNSWGTFLGGYSATVAREEFSGSDSLVVVVEESHIFRDPFPIILDNPNIELGSIVVTDSSGLFVYIEDDDYFVTVIDNRVHLNIDPFSIAPPNISDGQVLLVSYNYQGRGQRREDSTVQTVRVRQDFRNGFSLYYSHRRRDEAISSKPKENDYSLLDEYKTNTFGVDYQNNHWTLSAVHSRNKATQSPNDSTGLNGLYRTKIRQNSRLSIHISQNWLSWGGTQPRETSLFRTGGSILTPLTKRIKISSSTEWRNEDDDLSGRTKGFQVATELWYNYRLFHLKTGVEYSILDRRNIRDENVYYFFKITRQF